MRRPPAPALVLVGLAIACSRAGPRHEYPEELVRNFIQGCTARGAATAACECALDAIRERYTAEEYLALEARVARGDQAATRTVTETIDACVRR